MHRIRKGVWMLAILGGLAACGPEQSNRDRESAQIRETVGQQKASYDSINGNFTGVMTEINSTRKIKVDFVIRTYMELVPSSSRLDFIPIPSLVGNLSSGVDGTFAWAFTRGYYDATQGTLQMVGNDANGFTFFEAKLVGAKMVGTIMRGRYTSPITLTRNP